MHALHSPILARIRVRSITIRHKMFTTALIDLDDVIDDVVLITWYGGLFGQRLCDINMILNVLSWQIGTVFFRTSCVSFRARQPFIYRKKCL